MSSFNDSTDPWGQLRPTLKVGDIVVIAPRSKDRRVYAVASISPSRAHVFPLTPETRTIHVRDVRRPGKGKVQKEINETGDPIDISPVSLLPKLEVADLTDLEFRRLVQLIETGKLEFDYNLGGSNE